MVLHIQDSDDDFDIDMSGCFDVSDLTAAQNTSQFYDRMQVFFTQKIQSNHLLLFGNYLKKIEQFKIYRKLSPLISNKNLQPISVVKLADVLFDFMLPVCVDNPELPCFEKTMPPDLDADAYNEMSQDLEKIIEILS